MTTAKGAEPLIEIIGDSYGFDAQRKTGLEEPCLFGQWNAHLALNPRSPILSLRRDYVHNRTPISEIHRYSEMQ